MQKRSNSVDLFTKKVMDYMANRRLNLFLSKKYF